MSTNTGFDFNTVIAIIKRRKKSLILGFIISLISLVAISLLLKPVYRSSATILIEQQEIPQELVRSTVTSYAEQRVAIISQRVMTGPNLLEIVKKYDLYSEDRDKLAKEVIIEMVRENIARNTISADVVDPRTGRPTTATIAFKLSFDDHSAEKAQKVANELTSLYLNENLKTRAQMAQQAEQFLLDESRKLQTKLITLEGKIAEFKQQNQEALPEQHILNQQRLDRTRLELDDASRQLRLLEEKQIYYQSQLLSLSPRSNVINESGQAALSATGQLKLAQSQYLQKKNIYSADHPQIKRLLKEIGAAQQALGMGNELALTQKELVYITAQLQQAQSRYTEQHPEIKKLQAQASCLATQVDQLAQAKASAGAGGNNTATQAEQADNPIYIQMQSNLQATNNEIKSFKTKQIELQQRLDNYQGLNNRAPDIERQYREILRDYDNTTLKYREVKAKQLEADLAQSLEAEQKGERFTLIEPPVRAEQPIKPKRKLLLVVSFIFSVLIAVGVAFIREISDKKIYSSSKLEQILSQQALAVVPYIVTPDDLHQRKKLQGVLLAGGVASTALVLVVFNFAIMPLDVAWFTLLRKLA